MSQWTEEPQADNTSCLRTNVKHLFQVMTGCKDRKYPGQMFWLFEVSVAVVGASFVENFSGIVRWRKCGVSHISRMLILPVSLSYHFSPWHYRYVAVFFAFYHFKFYHALFETNYSIIKLPTKEYVETYIWRWINGAFSWNHDISLNAYYLKVTQTHTDCFRV